MPKNSHGEGSITRRKDGLWQASLQVDGTRRTVYAKSEREARAKLRTLQRQVDTEGALHTVGRRTMSDLVTAWLESAPDVKPTTAKQYRWFYDKYAEPAIGDIRLDKITPDKLQRFYARLTPAVGEKLHRVLHRAFAVAVLWRWLPSNPCDSVLKPAYKASRPNLWNREEIEVFLSATENHWLQPLWVLLLGTGCRLGEALALQWDSVGLGVAVTVDGTLHRTDGEWLVGEPKTRNAVRTVILPAAVTEALHRQKAQQNAWQEAAGHDWHDTGFVFTGKTGKPLFASTVQHAMKRMCTQLGLPPVTPHGLRHLHASLLLDEGVPVTAVSARLGHANPQITLRIYAHALAGQDGQAAQAIGHVFASHDTESRTEVGHEVGTE